MINQLKRKLKRSFETRKPVTLNALESQWLLDLINNSEKVLQIIDENCDEDIECSATECCLGDKEIEEIWGLLKNN
jgi:hypothetical protein